MFAFLLLPVMLVPPLLALLVLAIHLTGAARQAGARSLPAHLGAALRNGARRPVWPALITLAVGAAALTAALEQAYLAAAPRGSDWGFDVVLLTLALGLLAAAGCGLLAAIAAGAAARARSFGAGTVAGVLALLAVTAGAAVAHLPLRAAYLADPGAFPVVGNLGEGDLLVPFDAFFATLVWALPWPVLGAALGARRQAEGRQHRDSWQVLLELATADLPGNQAAWGTALRAELAAIDTPRERRRFALGGTWTALRSGLTQGAWLQASGVAVLVAGGVFIASRWSLAHEQGGVLSTWVTLPSVLLFVVTLTTAWRHRSVSAALRTGAVAGLGALAGMLAVSIPEAVVWAERHAGYLSTGDALPPTWQAAVGDVLRPEFLVGSIVFWAMGALSGAALGAAFGRLRNRQADEAATTR
ncbi:hypothetical protein [Paractinoplanes brasiliensis]|uniref:Uncharacterized protein n=1 Tax=Paractinoplanes brasiliensis TaxID=52695 RepID=A0A4R6JZF5_9ACTN|nr:hypothetical protein [Actinoplanes brasiliensis]TDO42264.1 hypothetical protein C8E87_6031 [Actinoplanes brasiliensis]GID29491.1 hypothetical protein Abr02nite_44740 [Actinoplanes brasiliensis]